MARITIDAPSELLDRLREIAKIRGVPVATVIREALEEACEPGPKPESFGVIDTEPAAQPSDVARRAGDMRFPPRSWR